MPAARSSRASRRTSPPTATAYFYGNGAEPFTYDPANEGEIGINLNSPEIKEVLDYWDGLVEKGLVGTEDQFTPEYIAGVIGGDYATYLSAAWAPGLPPGRGRRRGSGRRCVGDRPAAAVGSGQPDRDQLGRLGVRGEQPGDRP